VSASERTSVHPDQALVREVRAALEWWLGQPTVRPSSSVTGEGSVAVLEALAADLLGVPHALAVPNGTLALRVALDSVGVGVGSEVVVPVLDWRAAVDAVHSLGARAIPVAVDPETLTIDPAAAAAALTPRTTAVVATDLHGVPVDIDALRAVVGAGVPIVEDAAQALGATVRGLPAGSRADAAIVSLGPFKAATAGELGLILTSRRDVFDRSLRLTQHPLRLMLSGLLEPLRGALNGRIAPLVAIHAAHRLHEWGGQRAELEELDRELRADLRGGACPLDSDECRAAPGVVPVLVPRGAGIPRRLPADVLPRQSGADVVARADADSTRWRDLVHRVWVLTRTRHS